MKFSSDKLIKFNLMNVMNTILTVDTAKSLYELLYNWENILNINRKNLNILSAN